MKPDTTSSGEHLKPCQSSPQAWPAACGGTLRHGAAWATKNVYCAPAQHVAVVHSNVRLQATIRVTRLLVLDHVAATFLERHRPGLACAQTRDACQLLVQQQVRRTCCMDQC